MIGSRYGDPSASNEPRGNSQKASSQLEDRSWPKLARHQSADDSAWNFSLKGKMQLQPSFDNRISFSKLLNHGPGDTRFTTLASEKENISCNRQSRETLENNVKRGTYQCDNHEEKTATYYVSGEDSRKIYYCEKCAILTASQGFLVNKLKDKTQSQQISPKKLARCKTIGANRYMSNDTNKYHMREAQIKSLVTSLEVTARQLQNKQCSLDAAFSKSQQQFLYEVNHIDQYFNHLKSVIDGYRKAYHDALEQQNNSLLSLSGQLLALIKKSLEKTLTMREDLLNNLELVYNAKEQNYRQVVDNYLANNRNFTGLVQEWKEDELAMNALRLPELSRVVDVIDSSLQLPHRTACPSTRNNTREQSDPIFFSFEGSSLISQKCNSTLISTLNLRGNPFVVVEDSSREESSDSDLLME